MLEQRACIVIHRALCRMPDRRAAASGGHAGFGTDETVGQFLALPFFAGLFGCLLQLQPVALTALLIHIARLLEDRPLIQHQMLMIQVQMLTVLIGQLILL